MPNLVFIQVKSKILELLSIPHQPTNIDFWCACILKFSSKSISRNVDILHRFTCFIGYRQLHFNLLARIHSRSCIDLQIQVFLHKRKIFLHYFGATGKKISDLHAVPIFSAFSKCPIQLGSITRRKHLLCLTDLVPKWNSSWIMYSQEHRIGRTVKSIAQLFRFFPFQI
ncbi:hypothetical protein D3C87_1292910 [compost metagenome]